MQIEQFRQLTAALLGKHYGLSLADAGLAEISRVGDLLALGESVYQRVNQLAEKLEWVRIDQRGPYQAYYQLRPLTEEDELTAWQSSFPTKVVGSVPPLCLRCGVETAATPAKGPSLVWRHCMKSVCEFTFLSFQSSQGCEVTHRLPELPRSMHLTWMIYSPSKDRYWSNDFGWCFQEEASRWSFPGIPDTRQPLPAEFGSDAIWLSQAEAAYPVLQRLNATYAETLPSSPDGSPAFGQILVHGVRELNHRSAAAEATNSAIDVDAPMWFSVYVIDGTGERSVAGDFGSLLRATAYAYELSLKHGRPVSPYRVTLHPTSSL